MPISARPQCASWYVRNRRESVVLDDLLVVLVIILVVCWHAVLLDASHVANESVIFLHYKLHIPCKPKSWKRWGTSSYSYCVQRCRPCHSWQIVANNLVRVMTTISMLSASPLMVGFPAKATYIMPSIMCCFNIWKPSFGCQFLFIASLLDCPHPSGGYSQWQSQTVAQWEGNSAHQEPIKIHTW